MIIETQYIVERIIDEKIERLKKIKDNLDKCIKENRRISNVRCCNGEILELLNSACQKLQIYI